MSSASSSPFPEAGPSRLGPSTIFQRPVKLANRHPSLPPFASSSRFSTPARFSSPAIARFRGSSVASSYSARPNITNEEVRRRHEKSVQRLRTAWDLLMERYGSVLPEEDDEIDIFTEEIVVQRGKVAQLEGFDFGDISGSDSEQDDAATIFDSDEDELSVWDDRSGLDYQFGEEEVEPAPAPWTQEDDADLQSFLRAERARREATGERESTHDSVQSEEPRRSAPDFRRRRGTTILDEAQSVQDEDSDDEILFGNADEEREMRGIPAPARASTSRSPSPRIENPVRRQSLPSLPDKRARQAAVPKSTSAPTLRDLFTPPPDDPPIRVMSRKGKERMPSERPNVPSPVASASALDPTYYYQRYWHTSDGTGLRECHLCATAGGDRAKWAPLCKGRLKETSCLFSYPHPITSASRPKSRLPMARIARRKRREQTDESSAAPSDTEAFEADASSSGEESSSGQIESDEDDLESVNSYSAYSAPLRSPTEQPIAPPHQPPMPARQREPPSNLDPKLYYPSLRYARGGASTVRCLPCRQAGGDRAQLAEYCKGRRSRMWCPFVSFGSGDENYEADQSTVVASRQSRASIAELSSEPDTPAKGEGTHKRRNFEQATLETMVRKATVPRRARVIMSPEGFANQIAAEDEVSRTEMSSEATVPLARNSNQRNAADRMPETRPTSSTDSPELQNVTVPTRSTNSRANTPSHLVRIAPRYAAHESISVSTPSARSRTLPPSSPPVGDTSSRDISDRHLSAKPRAQIEDSSAGRPSLPPSSPPFAIFPRASIYTHPTPSPSLSSGVANSSPPLRSSPLTGASLLRKRPYVLLDSMRPTPPPSIAGRSSSLSSEHIPLTLPRKGILRQPSEAGSTPHSAKRARFSLAPRSPPHEPTSNPLEPSGDGESDDELLLNDTDPVCDLSPTHTHRTQVSSSSPFSREMSVRAADLGLRLGPEPTGRLSSTMVAALAPSLGFWKLSTTGATLGSTIIPSQSDVNAYSLPTPPRSFGSTTSSRPMGSPARSTPSSGKGLMLPPPVPASRLSARPLTPVSDPPLMSPTSSSAFKPGRAVETLAEQRSEVADDEEGIVIRHLPRAYLNAKARARSRSMSLVPRSGSMTPMRSGSVRPNTTPRRRSRLERDLARVARQVKDDAGLEWGLDEDVGEDCARSWREGSVVKYVT